MPSTKSVLAWHFLRKDGALRHRSPPQYVKVGRTYKEDPKKLEMCNRGLHGSIKLLDAFHYSPGPILCRTLHSGKIIKESRKLCSSERKVLWMGDIRPILPQLACKLLLEAIRKSPCMVSLKPLQPALQLFSEGKLTKRALKKEIDRILSGGTYHKFYITDPLRLIIRSSAEWDKWKNAIVGISAWCFNSSYGHKLEFLRVFNRILYKFIRDNP